MLVDVQSLFLYAAVDTDAHGLVGELEQQEGHHGAEDDGDDGGGNLYPQLVPVSVERALHSSFAGDALCGEDAGQDGADDASHAVHAEGVERVVIAQLRLDDCHHVEAGGGGDDADAEGSGDVHAPRCGSDGDQSGDGTRADAYGGRLAVACPVDDHPGQCSGAGGKVCHEEGVGGNAVGCQSATRVEAEPSQPEEGGAHEDKGHVVGCHGVSRTVVAASADEQCHHQGGDAGIDVHDGAAGKVDGAHLLQEAAAPYPVCHGDVDQDAPQEGEQQEAGELDALGKSAQDECRRDDGEHALEEHEQQFGDASGGQCPGGDA